MSEWNNIIGTIEGTVGVVLNTLAWLVILRTKSLHNMTNYLLAYLAVVDSLFCIVSVLYAQAGIIEPKSFTGREMYCRIFKSGFGWMITAYSSSYALCLVTYERYIGIVHPLHYPRLMSAKKCTFIIVMAWVISPLLSSPLLFRELAGNDTDLFDKKCFSNNNTFYHINLATSIVFSYLLPILFMSWAYYKIQATLKRTAQQFSQDEVQGAAYKLFKARRNVIYMLMIVMGAMVVLWTPVVGLLICTNASLCTSQATINLLQLFGLIYSMNSVINPIIYVFKNKKFRKGLQDMLCCCIGRHLRPNRIGVIDLNDRQA